MSDVWRTVATRDRKAGAARGVVALGALALLVGYGCGGSSTTKHSATESGGNAGDDGGGGRSGGRGGATGGVGAVAGTGAQGGTEPVGRGGAAPARGGAGSGARGGTDPGGAGGEAGDGTDVVCEPSVVLPEDTCTY